MEDNESLIWGLIRNAREKKNKKIFLQNIEIENENNKAIVKYRPSQIEDFFSPTEPVGNIVISGGVEHLRNRSILGSMIPSYNNGIPIVVIHFGNANLETLLQQQVGNLTVFNRKNSIYDPFVGLSTYEICRTIQCSATKQCELRSGSQYYIEGMTEFIRTKNIPPFCEMYMYCPHLELIDKVDFAESKGLINSNQSQKIKTFLVQGQAQRSDVENYFNVLRQQSQGLLCSKLNLNQAKSIRSVINNNGVCCFDVGSNTNDLLISLILEDLLSAAASGKKITLIIDNPNLIKGDKIENIAQNSGGNINLVLSSQDIFAAVNGDEALFSMVIGKALKLVVFNHSYGMSCNKLSDALGSYDKKEIVTSINQGTNYTSMFTVIPGQMNNQGITVNIKRENRVLPEEINKLSKDEVYIKDATNNELAYTTII